MGKRYEISLTPVFFSFKLIKGIAGLTEPRFLPFMCRLRVFEIHLCTVISTAATGIHTLLPLMDSLYISLTSPATLEHLKVSIVYEGGDDPFSSIDSVYNPDVWRHLDSIITRPTGSRLQKVDINIDCTFRYDFIEFVRLPDEKEVVEPILHSLPLLREKGILVVRATVTGRQVWK